MEKYYYVSSFADVLAEPDDEWYARFRHQYPCMYAGIEPLEIVVKNPGEDVPLNGVEGVGALFAHIDFLAAFGIKIEDYLLTGALTYPSGAPLKQFKTLASRNPVIIRGGPKSTRQFCSECGRFLYFPMGKWYLLESQLTGQPLYRARVIGLVVNHQLRSNLQSRRWRKLEVHELPVLEKPRDGLPADLSTIRPADLE